VRKALVALKADKKLLLKFYKEFWLHANTSGSDRLLEYPLVRKYLEPLLRRSETFTESPIAKRFYEFMITMKSRHDMT
jgi:hypothetical protein